MREGARAFFCYLFLVRFRLGKVKVKVWKNGGFGRRVGRILERPFLDQNVTKMTEVGVLRFFFENDRLWVPPVKTATPLSPKIEYVVPSYFRKYLGNNMIDNRR